MQVVNQLVSAYGTQVQVETGQRMVYDLRYRLFNHLQSLGLYHHVTTSTSDAVYRVDIDAYSIENLVMSGIFPLANSVTTLLLMFAILASKDLTIALLSLVVVPFLFVCLLLHVDARQPRRACGRSSSRKLLDPALETFSAMRLIKARARASEADRSRARRRQDNE